MLPPPPRSPRTDTRSPYPTLFLSYPPAGAAVLADAPGGALSARISRAAGNQVRLPRPRDGPGRRDRDHAPADPPLRHGRRDPVFGYPDRPLGARAGSALQGRRRAAADPAAGRDRTRQPRAPSPTAR